MLSRIAWVLLCLATFALLSLVRVIPAPYKDLVTAVMLLIGGEWISRLIRGSPRVILPLWKTVLIEILTLCIVLWVTYSIGYRLWDLIAVTQQPMGFVVTRGILFLTTYYYCLRICFGVSPFLRSLGQVWRITYDSSKPWHFHRRTDSK